MIYLATDHAGFELKEEVKKYLTEKGFEVEDMGAHEYNGEDDYPDFIGPAAQKVAHRQAQGEHNTYGIIFGASGQGEAMVANKVKGTRAAVYYGGSLELVKRARSHNDANILSLAARFLTKEEAFDAIQVWLDTEFEGGRHERRIQKMSELEK